MKLVIYEDNWENFAPLIELYPQFGLRIGIETIAENISRFFPKFKIAHLTREIFKLKPIISAEPTIYLSSRLVILEKFAFEKRDVKFLIGKDVVGFVKNKPPYPKDLSQIKNIVKGIKDSQKIQGLVINFPWDLIKYAAQMINQQFERRASKIRLPKNASLVGNKKDLYLAQNAVVHDFTFFDLSQGPIYIDRGAIIKPFSMIAGPCYIGKGTIIDRAKIVKSSIGPNCRISGEVEECIFQGFSNKQHEGFIGHSFIGEWVNLGAMTTNSDLKNNYGPVRVRFRKKEIDTGLVKVGCFIGDHTKTGIGTLIPTGAMIGSFVNFFGGGMMPQYVPNFKWLTTQKMVDHEPESAIKTAKLVMKRRNVKMTKHYEELVRKLHEQ